MKIFFLRFLFSLMICWLPIQGIASTIMLSCEEMTAEAHELHQDSFETADNELTDMHQKQSAIQNNTASSSVCQVDTICHTSCGTNMSIAVFSVSPIHNDTLNQHLSLPKHSFITGTQYRPPQS